MQGGGRRYKKIYLKLKFIFILMNKNEKKVIDILYQVYKKIQPYIPELPESIEICQLTENNDYCGFTNIDYSNWTYSSDRKSLIAKSNIPRKINVRLTGDKDIIFPIENILATFLHEMAHCITPGIMKRGRDINAKTYLLQSDEKCDQSKKWIPVHHSDLFYKSFARVLRLAEKLNIFILPHTKNKYTKRSLERFDAADSFNKGNSPIYS